MNRPNLPIVPIADKEGKAQVYISRHRIGTDGEGIRTLLSFTGCNLNCKYCINKELRDTTPYGKWYSPQELLDEILIDKYYFLVSNGGVTFSGGEPLLHANFIREFAELASTYGINMYIETSLNVEEEAVLAVHQYIKKWIVDIKDYRPKVYERYTGCGIAHVNRNISTLACLDASIHIRVPVIPGYNTASDIDVAINSGFVPFSEEIEKFNYVTCSAQIPEPDGKNICRVLKAVRRELEMQLILNFSGELKHLWAREKCNNTGNCLGTCPKCDQEMAIITRKLDALNEWRRKRAIRIMARIVHLKFKNELALNGIKKFKSPPKPLMGDPVENDWDLFNSFTNGLKSSD